MDDKAKILLKAQVKEALSIQDKVIKEALWAVKIQVLQKIKVIENLFSPFITNPKRKKELFEIPIEQAELKKIANLGEWFKHLSNYEFKKAIKNISCTLQRQNFRNSQILKLLDSEIEKYRRTTQKNKALKKLTKQKEGLGEMVKNYISKREIFSSQLQKEIKEVIRKTKKGAVINDILKFQNLCGDFFEQEEQYLAILKGEIEGKLNKEEHILATTKALTKQEIPELMLPG